MIIIIILEHSLVKRPLWMSRHLRFELMTYEWALAFSKVDQGPDPLPWVIEGELYGSSFP